MNRSAAWTHLTIVLLGAAACAGGAGCARRVNMAGVHGPDRAALTITYTGVQQEQRMFPDYTPLNAGILTPDGPAGKRRAP